MVPTKQHGITFPLQSTYISIPAWWHDLQFTALPLNLSGNSKSVKLLLITSFHFLSIDSLVPYEKEWANFQEAKSKEDKIDREISGLINKLSTTETEELRLDTQATQQKQLIHENSKLIIFNSFCTLTIVSSIRLTVRFESASSIFALDSLVNNIILRGIFSNDKINEILLDNDVLILPSYKESFGVVVIEALAAGLPVIATECGGPETIIKDDSIGEIISIIHKL